jgi:esterase/lipase superfamily enzyme
VRRTVLLGNSQRKKREEKKSMSLGKRVQALSSGRTRKACPQRNEKNNPVIRKSLQLTPQSRIIRSNPAMRKYQVFQLCHQENPVNFSHQEG